MPAKQRRGANGAAAATPAGPAPAPAKGAASPTPVAPFVALLVAGAGVVVWDRVTPLDESFKLGLLLLHATASLAALLLLVPPLAQPLAYHNFADRRCMCAVPNFCDVASNLPFLAVGLAALASLHGFAPGHDPVFRHEWERAGWTVFFAGVTAVSAGSAYYHWNPTNPTLVWDRLPMSVSFMALFGLMLEERVGAAHLVFMPLVAAGALTVFYWAATDDLRPYLFVQFYPMLCIPALYSLFESRYTRGTDVFLTLAWYLFAKLTEAKDREVFALTGRRVSGHTVKHLAAAAGLVHLHAMLVRREGL